jgi:hypothetical protein
MSDDAAFIKRVPCSASGYRTAEYERFGESWATSCPGCGQTVAVDGKGIIEDHDEDIGLVHYRDHGKDGSSTDIQPSS